MNESAVKHKGVLDIGLICDEGIVYSFCALIFCLPASIALVDSFAALVVSFYFIKKIVGLVSGWPRKASPLRLSHKILYIIRAFAPVPNVLNRALAILALGVFLSVVFSQYFVLSLYAFGGKLLKAIFLYFSFIEVFINHKRVWLFLSVFLFSAFLASLSGIIQHFFGMDFITRHHLSADGRVSSTFKLGNSFGVYLLVALGIAVPQAIDNLKRRKTALLLGYIILLSMLMFCLIWTFSRASWLGFISLMVFMMFLDKRKIIYFLMLLLIFFYFSLPLLKTVRHVALVRDDISENVDYTNNFKQAPDKMITDFIDQGGSGRNHFWKSAIFIFETYPVFGSGLNTYTMMLKRFSFPLWYAHNCYLQMAAETGVLGLSCFLGMLFVLFKSGIGELRFERDPWLMALLKGCLASLFGFLVESFLDNSLYVLQLVVLFWLMTALTVSVVNLNRKQIHDLPKDTDH